MSALQPSVPASPLFRLSSLLPLRSPRFAAVASGILLALAYPPWNLWPLAWVALVPLAFATLKLSALRSRPSAQSASHPSPVTLLQSPSVFRRLALSPIRFSSFILHNSSFRLGFWCGLTFWLSTLHWLLWLGVTAEGIPRWLAWILAVLAWTSLSAVCALFFGLWAMGLGALGKRFDLTKTGGSLAIVFLGSCLWVALEWVRAHVWVGFPWNQLGVSQYKFIHIIQIANLTGVYGISFLICFVSLALLPWMNKLSSEKVTAPLFPLLAALYSWGMAWSYGQSHINYYDTAVYGQQFYGLSVAVVQGNIAQNQKWREANEEMIRQRYTDLTLDNKKTRGTLIIWPETSVPKPLNFDPATYEWVAHVAREKNAYLLVGTVDAKTEKATDSITAQGNAAYLLRPDGRIVGEPYWKMRLVPFGEYLPGSRMFPFLKRYVPLVSLDAGKEYKVFEIPKSNRVIATKFCILICFEDIFAPLARQFKLRGANFLVNMTNDAWWGESAGAEQHAANAIFRAVENHVWLVRAANTGMSCFIHPLGKIYGQVQKNGNIFVEGSCEGFIDERSWVSLTFYTKYGDVFAFACLAITLLWLATETFVYAKRS